MRIRAAKTLVFAREGGQIVAFNYLAKSTFACTADLLSFLSMVEEWSDSDDILRLMPLSDPEEFATTIRSLVDAHALIEEGSELAGREEAFRSTWKWGTPAALLHFSVQDNSYMSLEESETFQQSKFDECPPPSLDLRSKDDDETIRLPAALGGNDLLQLMARRRTVRTAGEAPIRLDQLSDCLFAGLGITGQTSNCVGALPLKMTPSGGARNPYEAFVYARSVEGLAPGFYHYSAYDHSLDRVEGDALPPPSELLGGQTWADSMPCLIVLSAWFERTMWKYEDANAYRVVLIEAGHIGQNVMLAATRHGLSACPSAALSHSRINACIGGDTFMHAPIYAMGLCRPS
jgi:SagB-type dehydrogenase family enzyme